MMITKERILIATVFTIMLCAETIVNLLTGVL